MSSAIRQIAAHLSVDVTDSQVAQIADYCNIEKMRANKSVNSSWQEDFRTVDKHFGGHIRKGKCFIIVCLTRTFLNTCTQHEQLIANYVDVIRYLLTYSCFIVSLVCVSGIYMYWYVMHFCRCRHFY